MKPAEGMALVLCCLSSLATWGSRLQRSSLLSGGVQVEVLRRCQACKADNSPFSTFVDQLWP